ncbi:MAG TPA: hypothetical protein VN999_09470 [Thermoanaerobaculia bacterium]|nr:hypothetical protein [Thermoanaerobaculia bacterium]
MVQISQSGAAISGTFDNCSFHGTVSDTSISWTQDAQQAGIVCRVAYPIFCLREGGIELFFIRPKTGSIAGTVSGTKISASGSSTFDIVDPPTGQSIGTIQFTLGLSLQRQ